MMERVVAPAVSIAALAAAFFLFLPPPTWAAGEEFRRLTAEIAVMKADAERMVDRGLLSRHRGGIEARLRGGLAILPLLIGAARNKDPSLPMLEGKYVEKIRRALDKGDGPSVIDDLALLAAMFRFDATGLLPPDTRPRALSQARGLHEAFCAGCHDAPDLNVSRPAWNLFDLAKKIPPQEMAARLVIGVRGDNLTGLENPLRDAEISALIAFYRKYTATP